MSGRMRKRTGRFSAVDTKSAPAAKSFTLPQKDRSLRQRKKQRMSLRERAAEESAPESPPPGSL